MNKNFWHNKRVLITGHEGFLGSNLARRLCASGAKIFGVDLVKERPVSVLNGWRGKFVALQGDIADFSFVRKTVNKHRPNVIFHLAAETIVGEAKKAPLATFKSNIEGTWNIMEACRDKKFIQAVIAASSDKAYGTSRNLPYKEDSTLEGRHPYDASKTCADIIARAYYFSYNLPVCVARCGNIYGPGDFHFSRLIPDAVRSLLEGRELVIRSDGKYIRDYIYVDDAVEGYLLLAERARKQKLWGEAFNFGNQRPLSVLEAIEALQDVYGSRFKKLRFLNKAGDEIREQFLSCGKARRILGWHPRYSLAEGLKATFVWYRNNMRSIVGRGK